MPAARVVVVGSANADLVVDVERHPAPGETVLGGDVRRYPGGKGANQAVAAARLGAEVHFVGKVGRDTEGELLAAALDENGVGRATLGLDPGRPSGLAFITVDGAGENTIVVSPGANHGVEPADVDAAFDALAPFGVVMLQCELPLDTLGHAARSAAGRGARVVLNLAPPAPLESGVLACADPLVVNAHEATYLLGERPGDNAAQRLRALGPVSAVVTFGRDGALAGDTSGLSSWQPPRVPVVDTTGAGDAFTGALAARLARGDEVHAATGFAVRGGAEAVRTAGAQSSFPAAEDVGQY